MPRAGPGMKPSALQLVLSENIRSLSEFHILPSHFSIYMRYRFYQTWLIFYPTFYKIVSLHCILSGSYLRSVIEMELWNFRSLQRFKLLVFSQFRHYNYPALIHQAETPRYLVFENWNLSSLPSGTNSNRSFLVESIMLLKSTRNVSNESKIQVNLPPDLS
jgi:hypothetical protein